MIQGKSKRDKMKPHLVRVEVPPERGSLRIVQAVDLLEEAGYEVFEECVEVDGGHVIDGSGDLLPQ